MKKYLPANKWLLKTAALVLFTAILMVVHSCKKDLTKQEQALTDPDIIQAKSWYQGAFPAFAKQSSNGAQLISTSASGSATTELDQYIDPDWANTNKYNRFNKNVYEIPVNPDNKFAAALKNANNGKNYADKANSKTSFLILKDDAGYHAYVMTIIADSAYLKGDLTKLARNSYAKRDTDFSGLVLYFTPKGTYVNGYAYKNGKIVTSGATSQSTSNKILQSNTDGKHAAEVAAQDCTDWFIDEYQDDVLVASYYIGTTCDGGTAGGGGGGGAPALPPCPTSPANPDYPDAINTGKTISQVAPVDNPIGDGGDDGGMPDPTSNTCTITPNTYSTDCSSFTFVKTSIANWQEAGVKDIRLKWQWVGGSSGGMTREVYLPSVVFGMPTQYQNKDGSITPLSAGQAAVNAAKVTEYAKYLTYTEFANSPYYPDDIQVLQYFKTQLQNAMAAYRGTAGATGSGSNAIIFNTEERSTFFPYSCGD